jgi:hypothetical protein
LIPRFLIEKIGKDEIIIGERKERKRENPKMRAQTRSDEFIRFEDNTTGGNYKMARRKKDPMKPLKEFQKQPANKKCADCTEKVGRQGGSSALAPSVIRRDSPDIQYTHSSSLSLNFGFLFPGAAQFPQYANLTMNTFVCTPCSGIL